MISKKDNSFQWMIQALQGFWGDKGCVMLQSFDQEVGAGTLSPYTALHLVTKDPISVCYPQFSTRPTDCRFARNPNRLGGYYQFQVILKPAENFGDIQLLYLKSIQKLGIEVASHDIVFLEDDWQNESIGAAGLGYEVRCDGLEVSQFTYVQMIGGIECDVISCELTYGLERLAMYIQQKETVFDIEWATEIINDGGLARKAIKYGDIHTKLEECDRSEYFSNYTHDTPELRRQLDYILGMENGVVVQQKTGVEQMLDWYAADDNGSDGSAGLEGRHCIVLAAYRKCLSASHILNVLDARGVMSPQERMKFILRIRTLVGKCVIQYKQSRDI